MAQNVKGTSKATSTSARSVIHCTKKSDLTWDLAETTIHWILLPITIVASLATIILNGLLILAVQRKRDLKKPSTILLCSMAVADLLVGAISMPLTVAADILIIDQMYYPGFCSLYLATEYSMLFFIWSSLYHLSLIAWERYVAVRKMIDYKAIVTQARMKALAVFAWLLAAFTSFPPLIMLVVGVDYETHEAWHIGEGVVAVIALIVIAYFYITVYLGVRKRKTSDISQIPALLRAKLESKVAKTTGLITFALILSFVPVIVLGALGEVFPDLLTNKAFRLPQTLVQFNSLVNPLIYFYRDRRFRNATLELLGFRRSEATQPAGGAMLFVRRKNPFGSPEDAQEVIMDNAKQHTRTKRAASCDLAVVSLRDRRKPCEIFLKRSMSFPSLQKYSGSTDDLQPERPSFVVVTTAIIHTERGGRHQRETSYNRELPQAATKPQYSILLGLVRNKRRSKSWDGGASVKCANRTCPMLQVTPAQRPTTAS